MFLICHLDVRIWCKLENSLTHQLISSAPMWMRMSVDVKPIVTPSISRVQGSGTRVTRCKAWRQTLYNLTLTHDISGTENHIKDKQCYTIKIRFATSAQKSAACAHQHATTVSNLGLFFAGVGQAERRLWVDEMVVDVSLRRRKHQLTANTGLKKARKHEASLW